MGYKSCSGKTLEKGNKDAFNPFSEYAGDINPQDNYCQDYL
jgi:hypothetical protein